MTYTTFGHTFANISEMKAFALEHNIEVPGNKSFKQTWFNAIETYMEVQSEVLAAAADARIAALEAASDSVEIADVVETVAVLAVDKAVEIATHPTTIAASKGLLRAIALTIAFVILMGWNVAKWCYAHRSDTAVYHWIAAAKESQCVKSLVAHWLEMQAGTAIAFSSSVRFKK